MSIYRSIACIAVLGTGYSASAGVVSGSQTFYNMSASSRTYTYYQYAPLSGGSGGNVMNGSVTATLTDLNGNGALLSTDTAGNAIYTATLNDVAVQTLWSSPFGLAVGPYLSNSACLPVSPTSQYPRACRLMAIREWCFVSRSALAMPFHSPTHST